MRRILPRLKVGTLAIYLTGEDWVPSVKAELIIREVGLDSYVALTGVIIYNKISFEHHCTLVLYNAKIFILIGFVLGSF